MQALIHRLRGLLDQGGWNADSPAGQELKAIINLRVTLQLIMFPVACLTASMLCCTA